MKKTTTVDKYKVRMKRNMKVVAPSTETIDLLKVFARTYHVEKKIKEPLNAIFVN